MGMLLLLLLMMMMILEYGYGVTQLPALLLMNAN